jgi:hypothetical protein
MKNWFQVDERSERIGDRLGLIFLGITQVGLYLAIIYQRYIRGLDPTYYNDLAILLGISAVGYWGMRFYLGGVLPILSLLQVVWIYLIFVFVIALPYLIVHGLPNSNEWARLLVPMLGGPAVLVGGYALLAYFGKKRIDKSLSQKE